MKKTTIDLNVQLKSSSDPVHNAKIVLIVVDEAILSLTPETGTDFIRTFYNNSLTGQILSHFHTSLSDLFNPDWNRIKFLSIKEERFFKRKCCAGKMASFLTFKC